jgi:adenylate cyclase
MSLPEKILIVDDDVLIIDYLEQALEDLGYSTERAADGLEALNRVAIAPPDLILLDVMMPRMDGFTVCRMLKGNDETRLIPIVVMTALGDMQDRIKAIELGADDVLNKPVNERQLIARVQTALRLKGTVDAKLQRAARITHQLSKFVPEHVARIISANPESGALRNREQDVSILLLDVSSYTHLSEILPLTGLNDLIERYFAAFLDCVTANGGDITDFTGDGFAAVFRNAQPADHAIAAVRTAVDLQAVAGTLNREHAGPGVGIHIGVNSGRAFFGSTRLEGTSGTRWILRASGLVINMAARLASVAREGEIVIGPETANRVKGRFEIEEIGAHSLKNIAEPITLFRVVSK